MPSKSNPSGFVTTAESIDPPDLIVDDTAGFLSGVGRFLRVYGTKAPAAGQSYRFDVHVTDWALEDGEPLSTPVLEVAYFDDNGDKVIHHREAMYSKATNQQSVGGAFYYLDVPLPTGVDAVQATALIHPSTAEQLENLIVRNISGGLIPSLLALKKVDLQATSLITPQIDTMHLSLVAGGHKLDIIGIVTKGLLQFK